MTGFKIDLTNDDFVRVGSRVIGSEGDVRSTPDGVGGTDWSEISYPVLFAQDCRKDDILRDGRALSFALRLKKRKSGTNQTQTAKKAAISMKVSSPAAYPLPFGVEADPYLYLGPFHFFCSCALWAK